MPFAEWLSAVNSLAWGAPTLVLLAGTGIYLTLGLRFMPIRRIGSGFRELLRGRTSDGPGEIPPARSLTTALSATIGTGNIAGVSTAIVLGGPGAVFWMWMMALVGTALKYSEAVLAVRFRETAGDSGEYHGGPMYYIEKGLGPRWRWLAVLFALFAAVAAFGIGNMTQSNSVADALHSEFAVPEHATGIGMAALAGLIVVGGLKRIAAAAARLVPLMAAAYILIALYIILANITAVPDAFAVIVRSAFSGHAAVGGFSGAAVMMAIQFGIARGLFSNEAGLGSAPIAHAAAQTESPVRQGQIAMLGTVIDTLIVCTMTALVVVISGAWTTGADGAALATAAFSFGLPFGGTVISVALAVFAFTTVLGWCVYGERSARYLFGGRVVMPFRILWIVALYIGSTMELQQLWLMADTLNAFMVWPNLIALILLSGVVFKLTEEHESGPS